MTEKKSFWSTVPGLLTAVAALISAMATLFGVLYTAGMFGETVPSAGNGQSSSVPGSPPASDGRPPAGDGQPPVAEAEQTFRLVEVMLRADPVDYLGPCPVTVKFSGRISVIGGPGNVSYRFERNDAASSPVQSIRFHQSGSQDVQTTWRIGSPGFTYDGWQRLSVLEPQEIKSNPANFRIRCDQPEVEVSVFDPFGSIISAITNGGQSFALEDPRVLEAMRLVLLETDNQRAKMLLAEAGWIDGISLNLSMRELRKAGGDQADATQAADKLRDIGVELRIDG